MPASLGTNTRARTRPLMSKRRTQEHALAADMHRPEHRGYAKAALINQPLQHMPSPKSKWFRVATEGATTDGREITRVEIEQMAKTYSREKYGARIWLEHYRGMVPGGPFDALGDVLAVEARDVEDGKKALFAQIEPLPTLIEMNKKGQKLYSSIEIHPSFPTTGGAYLFGLGVTDSPASLGTEVLKFAAGAQANPFADRKADKAVLFSAAQEFSLEFEDQQPTAADTGVVAAALSKFTAAIEKLCGSDNAKPEVKNLNAADKSAEILAALQESSAAMKTFAMQQVIDGQTIASLQGKYNDLQKAHDDVVKKLSTEPEGAQRPAATGGNGREMAEY